MWKHVSRVPTCARMTLSLPSTTVESATGISMKAATTLSRSSLLNLPANRVVGRCLRPFPSAKLCTGKISGPLGGVSLRLTHKILHTREWLKSSPFAKWVRGGDPIKEKPPLRMLSTMSRNPGAGTPSDPVQEDNRELMVQHILVPADQLQTLLKLQTRIIQEDIDLSDLATEFSICPSKKEGGMLGWIARGETLPEFEEAAFSAPIDKLVRVQTKHGWHLLQVVAEREPIVVHQLSVEDLGARLAQLKESANEDDEVQLMDVREASEAEIASIPGFKLYPLSKFGEWAPTIDAELNPLADTIVLCHHGIRSQQAANWLKSQGFSRLFNVSGGIDAYSRKVDSSIPKY